MVLIHMDSRLTVVTEDQPQTLGYSIEEGQGGALLQRVIVDGVRIQLSPTIQEDLSQFLLLSLPN